MSSFATDLEIMKLGSLLRNGFEEFRKEFRKINDRFEQIDCRFNQIDTKFNQIDARFNEVDARFTRVDSRFNQIDITLAQINKRLDNHDNMFEIIQARLDQHTLIIHDIRNTQDVTLTHVGRHLEKINARIDNIKSENNLIETILEEESDQNPIEKEAV